MDLSKIRCALKETGVRLDDVRPSLWNSHIGALSYEAHNEKYQSAILEQYKIYVEMADRISARRALANTFFLTLNTAVFTAIGVFWKDHPRLDLVTALPTARVARSMFGLVLADPLLPPAQLC